MSVIVYTKSNCPACDRLKQKLKHNGIVYETKNVDTDLDAMDFVVAQGHRAMPVVYQDGKHIPTNEIGG